jgi:hypothetical protein
MPELNERPTVIAPAGNQPKWVEAYVGRVNSQDDGVSVSRHDR